MRPASRALDSDERSPNADGLARRFGLHGRVVLITGATSGIGRAMAQAFGEAGASVVVAAEDADRCREVAEELSADAITAIGVRADVTVADDLAALRRATLTEFGRIDVAVANAGIAGPFGPMGEIDDADWDRLIEVNLRHPFRLANLVAPDMAATGGGCILLTASIAGIRGNAGIGVYGMTKAGLLQLARNLAVEWGPRRVRANALVPGLTNTSWTGRLVHDDEAVSRRLRQIPIRRIATTDEIAGAAVFLAGPAAASITGQSLVIDGGTTISDGS